MNKKEMVTAVKSYIIVVGVVFLLLGTALGHFAFPRIDWYEYPKCEETIFVNYNGEAVPYEWNISDETWHLQTGVIYDYGTDRYYCTEGCWAHGTWGSNDGYPNILHIDRKTNDGLSLNEQIILLQEKLEQQQSLIINLTETKISNSTKELNYTDHFVVGILRDIIYCPERTYFDFLRIGYYYDKDNFTLYSDNMTPYGIWFEGEVAVDLMVRNSSGFLHKLEVSPHNLIVTKIWYKTKGDLNYYLMSHWYQKEEGDYYLLHYYPMELIEVLPEGICISDLG